LDIPHALQEYFHIFVEKLNRIDNPFEQSFFSLLKYRTIIHTIIRTMILEKTVGPQVLSKVKQMIRAQLLPEGDAHQLFKTIETEILGLRDGNIARFRVRPSEYQEWQSLQ
jgi:hypothetical protein